MSFKGYVLLFGAGLVLAPLATSQSTISLAGIGYASPAQQMRAAPGQLVTFFLTGVQAVSAQPRIQASKIPLPTALAGLSATVTQTWVNVSKQLPVLSVAQDNICADQNATSPNCLITALTVQMPSDLAIPNPLAGSAALQTTQVTISENGTPSQAFLVFPSAVNGHILTTCDTTAGNPTAACSPVITHADGTLVSSTAPAKVGEIVVMYALGLGATSPLVPEGQATPVPAPTTTTQFGLSFDYANPLGLLPSSSLASAPALRPSVSFAGLTPGEVGLYQINFTVQAPPFAGPSCPEDLISNLTVKLVAAQSATALDTAAMCVDTSSASAAKP